MGTVQKLVKTNGRTSMLVFSKAIHTPDLAANLISIGKFDDLGFLVIFKEGKALFQDKSGTVFMEGSKLNQMYLLNLCLVMSVNSLKPGPTEPDPQNTMKALVASSLNKPVGLDIWH